MPPTRRSTRSSSTATGSGSTKHQSTLNFKHRVTKPVSSTAKDTKEKETKSPARAKKEIIVPAPEPAPKEEQDEVKEEETNEEVKEVEEKEVKNARSDPESRAAKVTNAQIEKYWKGIEASRMAKELHRKHGQGLSTEEKVLRYFDVSSQYGPCVGITRLRRWQRAERLGLNPPIEVLAVLMKEKAKGNEGIQRAHMDELLSSTAVGSV
nr:DNA polymerase delta 4 accessory subunit [Thermochaetoides thermophila]